MNALQPTSTPRANKYTTPIYHDASMMMMMTPPLTPGDCNSKARGQQDRHERKDARRKNRNKRQQRPDKLNAFGKHGSLEKRSQRAIAARLRTPPVVTRNLASSLASNFLHSTTLLSSGRANDNAPRKTKNNLTIKSSHAQGTAGQALTSYPNSVLLPHNIADEDDSEEGHERELDRLMTLHLAQGNIRKQNPAVENVLSLIVAFQDYISNQGHFPNDYTCINVDPTVEFLLALQDEQVQLNHRTMLFEAEIERIRKKNFTLDTTDHIKIERLEEKLKLTSTLCFGLFIAEYAFCDMVDEKRTSLDGALVELRGSVGRMVEVYDGDMERLGA
jgi:hypothetical protein